MFLFDFVSKFNPKGRVLDVGCGSGVIGLLLKRDFDIELYGIDKQEINIQLSKNNSIDNGLDGEFVFGDFGEFKFDKTFDIIVSNPPFYHEKTQQSTNEHINISRYSNHLPLDIFFEKAYKILTNRGQLFLCYDSKQIDRVLQSVGKFKVTDIRPIYPKQSKNSSIFLLRCMKNSKNSIIFHQPLFAFDGDNYSNEAIDIYNRCSTESLKI
jgi:tRNA1(Val) A37 N6-methylase TrmN6